ncbi:unnamed protein product [Prorocentrum cordatum]|uniref:PDZ domain-containing protein n=1 Tax=Prorocentrum cordatum TaxID=2364126 RepID=A0ABN9YIH5_9DINO|nr:unnamed protein product [Polarella glacialis]
MGDASSKCCGNFKEEGEIGDAPRPEDPYKDPAPGKVLPPKRSAGDRKDDSDDSSDGMYGRANGKAKEFVIAIDRSEGDRLGMDVDHSDELGLTISHIEPGLLLAKWNSDHPDKAVKRGDCIVEVRGLQLFRFCRFGRLVQQPMRHSFR